MSETETAPQGGGAPAPESETEGAAPVESTQPEAAEHETEEAKAERSAQRRIAKLTARVTAGDQERARLAAEVEALRRGAQPQGDGEHSPEVMAAAQRLAAEMTQAERAKERMDRFHTEGRAAHADWSDRCQSLMQMGADAGLSHILVEMDNGARVAGALADDPEALERIASIKTERGRAISLGMYAAQLADKPAPPVRRVSNAPAPIRPVTGGARVEFNPYNADSDALVDYYSREAMKARGL